MSEREKEFKVLADIVETLDEGNFERLLIYASGLKAGQDIAISKENFLRSTASGKIEIPSG